MRSFIKFILSGILFIPLSPAFSQQQGLSTKILWFQDTSSIAATDSVVIRVKNLDTSACTGYINFYYSTDTVAFTSVSFCSINNVSLAGGDSMQTTCSIYWDSTYFHTGNNIVVVWSSGNAKIPADSSWNHIYLNPSVAGVHEIDIASAFTIYPTITTDFIFIDALDKNLLPKKIFIEDVTGKIISVATSFDPKDRIRINTSQLKNGIYFLDILLPDKQRMVSKFVKTG